jgi:hypothetical protein
MSCKAARVEAPRSGATGTRLQTLLLLEVQFYRQTYRSPFGLGGSTLGSASTSQVPDLFVAPVEQLVSVMMLALFSDMRRHVLLDIE